MNRKIKFIRETLNLTATEISRFLNISSYKYIYYEKSSIDIPCEILLLLAKIYGISFAILIDNNIGENDIILELNKQSYNFKNKLDTLKKLEYNFANNLNLKITYHLIKNTKETFQQNIINTIYTILLNSNMNLNDFSNYVGISKKNIDSILKKKRFITVNELVCISNKFNISVDSFIEFEDLI